MSSIVNDKSRMVALGSVKILDAIVAIPPSTQTGIQAGLKRGLDVLVSIICLGSIGANCFCLSAWQSFWKTGWPVFFYQGRVGQGGRKFAVYKFRSMAKDAESRFHEVRHHNQITDGPIFKLKNDPRITRIGQFLRRTSLDELPQLLNVLKGEMSLVGPRPPLESEVLLYSDWHLKRLSVKAGMTGLWQVSGQEQSKASMKMVQLDVLYIDNWSIWQDFSLLARTPLAVFPRQRVPF